MKKVISFCLILLLLAVAASAQRRAVNVRSRASAISVTERVQLQRDMFRYRIIQRNTRINGIITPLEQDQLNRIKRKTRRNAIRFRHNGRNRVL